MNTPDYLIFDLDGTLIDSFPDIALSLNLLRAELDLAPLPFEVAAAMVGDGASLLVERGTGDLYRPALVERFINIYSVHLLDNTKCYPGIEELLQLYPADKLAIVTNKPIRLALEALDGLGLRQHFAAVIGGDSYPHKKPHPQPVLEALAQLGAAAVDSVMVGDNHTDLRAGQAAGTKCCFCAYGCGHTDGVEFDYRAEQSSQLLELFPR